ncbi:hypothetical protein [Pseudomonas sp. UBA6323]|uniref:hypothetical protein n=1 Tax=Pseudomonas sp. UBA6323 TaxID=1947329 RepID=UPI0025D3017B|nr:hypothetical protein [Pseudomonas sp. UBA6323]
MARRSTLNNHRAVARVRTAGHGTTEIRRNPCQAAAHCQHCRQTTGKRLPISLLKNTQLIELKGIKSIKKQLAWNSL